MKIEDINFDLLNLKLESKILDLGCGRGSILIPLWKKGFYAVGVDINTAYLNEILNSPNLPDEKLIIHSPGENLPFEPNTFDIIICREVLEHVSNPELILKEIYRVLKPNSYLCLTIPYYKTERLLNSLNPNWLSISGHKNVFSIRTLRDLLQEAGFSIVCITRERFFYTYFWFFHCIFRTPHDGTGRPLKNYRLTKFLFFLWNQLVRIKVSRYIVKLGNFLLPKSIYIYCQKKTEKVRQE